MTRTFTLKSSDDDDSALRGENSIFEEDEPTDVGDDISWGPLSFDGVQNVTGLRDCACNTIVSWDRAEDSTWPPISYNVYYRTVSPPFNGTKIDAGYETSYTITNLNESQLYYFGVRCVNSSIPSYEYKNSLSLSRQMPYPCHLIGDRWAKMADYLDNTLSIVVELNNKIYAGGGGWTSKTGVLYEWDGVDSWIKRATRSNDIYGIVGMTTFNNKIYGVGHYKFLVEWNGVDAWDLKVPTGGFNDARSPIVFNSELYIGSIGALCKWDNNAAWITVAPAPSSYWWFLSIVEFNGKLYCAGDFTQPTYHPSTNLFEWDGMSTLVEVAPAYLPDPQQPFGDRILKLIPHMNRLYGATGMGRLLEWNGTDAWNLVAEQRYAGITMQSGISYCDKIYCGDTLGNLMEWNTNEWIRVASPSFSNSRAEGMLFFDNHLYACTSNTGYLLRWDLSPT